MSLLHRLRRGVPASVAAIATSTLASVAFAAPSPTGDIRDIRGPIAIPVWWHWPLAITVAVLAAVAVGFGVRAWRRRHGVLSPVERAREALTRAEAEARAGRSHEWAEIVAGTLRGALAARIGSTILPQTTSELAQAEWTRPPLSVEVDAPHVLELFAACDVARFAKASFEPEALVASTAVARDVTERLFGGGRKASPPVPVMPETVSP